VRGLTIHTDTTNLTGVNFYEYPLSGYLDLHATHDLQVVPGLHKLAVGFDIVEFTVTPAGTITYDPSGDSFLSGAGTSTIVVRGLTIHTDTTNLTGVNFYEYPLSGYLDLHATHDLQVVPGLHKLAVGFDIVEFTVTPAGTVTYDPSGDSFLSGAGTSTIVVRGLTIHTDTTNLTGVNFYEYPLSGYLDLHATHDLQVVPGLHKLAIGFGVVEFTVTPSGTITYDAGLSGYLAGADTSTIVVRGFTVAVDATGRPGGFSLYPLTPNLDSSTVQTVHLVPGQQEFMTGDGSESFMFTVGPAGTLDYAAGQPGVSGRGTATLTVTAACC
jgi:hypothetical protein